ncbi:MAG: tape measure protein [Brevundimonas sp.]|uniref:tape measure protein n=1 Tax=Brevundimonas sp. TaxID=1871086 RepID=UPI001A29A397|nr:tape measure protein [Brevundimonas sp.]MBJ7318232.1 tape measure protein [Brevundimonas sp.]
MSDLIARLRLEATAGNVPAVATQTERSLDGVRAGAQRAGAGMGAAQADANRLAVGLDRTGDQADRLERRMSSLRGGVSALGGVLGATGLAVFAGDISKAAFAAGGLELGLGAVAGGAAGASAELAFVRTEAARLGLVAQATSKDFLSLAASTNGTAIAGEQTRQVWLATAEAGMALGRAPDQIGRGLTALSQIAGKGVVSMEEVRQQLAEAIPGAAVIGARAMNMTSAEFNKLVESGKLTAEVFLPAFAAQLREEFGPAIDAYLTSPLGIARQEIGKVQTTLNDLRAASGEGFLEGVTDGLKRLNAELDGEDAAERARDIGRALGEAATVGADALIFLIDHLDELQTAAEAVAGVALVRFLTGTAAAAREAAAAYVVKAGAARTAAATAQQGLAAEAVALGGVRGAIVQAAQAEVVAARAIQTTTLQRVAAAEAALALARVEAATITNSATLAQRRQAVALAEAELTAARNASAVAAGRVAVAEAGQARSLTGLGQAAGVAKAGMSGLLGLVGGPWGAAFLAAGAAVYSLVKAQEAEEAKSRELQGVLEEGRARYVALDEARRALGGSTGEVIAAEDQAAVSAANLAGEVDKLADAHYRAAAAAQWHALQELKLQATKSKTAADEALGQYNQRREIAASAERTVSTPYGSAPMIGGSPYTAAGDARARNSEEYRTAAGLIEVATRDQAEVRAAEARLRDGVDVPEPPAATNTVSDSKGSKKRDRARDLAEDLALEEAAFLSHAEAALKGEAALDQWRITQAGVEAVARAGVAASSSAATAIRDQAEQVERLAIADERIERAAGFRRAAEADTAALVRKGEAALRGQAALEALRISEAGLEVLSQARVESLDQLNGKEREAVAAAVASAEARERQAIATEKAEAAGRSIEELDRQIATEERRQAVVGRGVEAEVAYARAEFVRQEVERAGLRVTDEAARAIIDKANALFRLQAISDGSQAAADAERELRLMRLSNRERELAVRSEKILAELAATRLDLSEQERAALADRRAQAELEAEETAAAIGRITTSLRDGFIKDGKLGMDEVGDYAEERLRAAVYDAFLADPIRIFVEATVDIANDLAKDVLKGIMGGGSGGGLGKMLGFGGQTGGAAGGLSGFSSLGANWNAAGLLGQAGIVAGIGALGSQLAGSITGALGGNVQKAQSWGWLGGIPGLIAGLTDKADRPYARADVEVQNGKFVLAGTQAADGGDEAGIAAAGKALADQLNTLAKTFGLDLSKVENLYTTLGKTQGGNAKALGGDGFFGGAINGLGMLDGARDVKGWTLGAGVKFSQGQDAEAITEQILRDTLLRAINAGASDLSEAEKRFVAAAESLDEAVDYIEKSRGFGQSLDDMLLELLDPAAFEKKKALDAVEATYQALKAEAEKMIGAGLLSADVLKKIEQLRDLQLDAALKNLEGAAGATGNPFADVRDKLKSWLDALAISDLAPGGPMTQRADAMAQYERMLTLARMGDQTALANLTTYADRLLRADREATGSAEDRTALYNRVTADVAALVEQIEPLTPAAIAGPIVEALGASQTAVAQVLKALPPEIAAPLLAAILREPDWATQLLGENVQVPPALEAVREQVRAASAETAGPIVEAVLKTPEWAVVMAASVGTVTPSIALLQAALAGLPPELVGPILAALTATPAWADASLGYLSSLPPSLELIGALLAGQPAAIAGPIIAALERTPAWANVLLQWLSTPANDNPTPTAPKTDAVLDPLAELAGLSPARGGKNRPYSRADIVAMNGQWTVAGLETADGGDRAAAQALGSAITESLNAASALFGIDVKALEGLYTTAGFVTGKNFKALGGEGFFGGDINGSVDYWNQAGRDKKGNTVGSGVTFEQVGSAADLAEQVVWETIQRAIAAGGSKLTADQAAQIKSAGSLEAALAALSRLGAAIETPVLSPKTGAGTGNMAGRTDLQSVIDLRTSLTDQMVSLQQVFEDQFTALAEATADGLSEVAGLSSQQLAALRDLASSQRVANAHAIAKAA